MEAWLATAGRAPTEPWLLAALAAAAFATATLSAVVGMAGGMTLLGVLLLVAEPVVAIPVHAVVQLASNASRTWYQRAHVEWRVARSFVLPLLPAGALGLLLAHRLPPDALRVAIAALVLVATWRPGWLQPLRPAGARDAGPRFFLLGGAIGFLNVTVGATGVLAAPFFLGLGLSRQGVIGTSALCQTAGHAAKILLFGLAGFAFGAWALPLAILCAASLAGARFGTALLGRLSEARFTWLYRAVLTLLALQLLLESVAPAVAIPR